MTKCVFCGKDELPHIGTHVIKNTGVINYFCSRKCRANSEKLKRDKRKIRWTEAFHITREKARAKAKVAKEAEKSKNSEKDQKKKSFDKN